MERRKFLRSGGLLASAGFFTARFPFGAGPFSHEDFPHPWFPADKKLDARWIQSLDSRGMATFYSKSRNELRFIGMPVGGICGGGKLTLSKFTAELNDGATAARAEVKLDDTPVPCSFSQTGNRCEIALDQAAFISADSVLALTII